MDDQKSRISISVAEFKHYIRAEIMLSTVFEAVESKDGWELKSMLDILKHEWDEAVDGGRQENA